MKKSKCLLFLLAMMAISLLSGGGSADKFAGCWVSEVSTDWAGFTDGEVLEIKPNGDSGYIIENQCFRYIKDKDGDRVIRSNHDEMFANKPKEGNTITIQQSLGRPTIVYDENNKTLKTDLGRMSAKVIEFKQVNDKQAVEQLKEKVLEAGRAHEAELEAKKLPRNNRRGD